MSVPEDDRTNTRSCRSLWPSGRWRADASARTTPRTTTLPRVLRAPAPSSVSTSQPRGRRRQQPVAHRVVRLRGGWRGAAGRRRALRVRPTFRSAPLVEGVLRGSVSTARGSFIRRRRRRRDRARAASRFRLQARCGASRARCCATAARRPLAAAAPCVNKAVTVSHDGGNSFSPSDVVFFLACDVHVRFGLGRCRDGHAGRAVQGGCSAGVEGRLRNRFPDAARRRTFADTAAAAAAWRGAFRRARRRSASPFPENGAAPGIAGRAEPRSAASVRASPTATAWRAPAGQDDRGGGEGPRVGHRRLRGRRRRRDGVRRRPTRRPRVGRHRHVRRARGQLQREVGLGRGGARRRARVAKMSSVVLRSTSIRECPRRRRRAFFFFCWYTTCARVRGESRRRSTSIDVRFVFVSVARLVRLTRARGRRWR